MRRLLIRPGAIGDFIVSLPALEHLRTEYTEIWCPSVVAPLARFADRTASIAGSGIDRVGLMDAEDVWRRWREFDDIHSWYGTNRPDFQDAVRDLPFLFYPALPIGGQGLHAVDYYLGQIGAPPGAIPRLPIDAGENGGWAVLHPFSGSKAKNWPWERWLALEQLLEQRMAVRWCIGPEDGPLPVAGRDEIRVDDLWELARTLRSARIYIGNDSGITHLAAAAGAAVIALFGPSDPKVWAPRGKSVIVIHRPSLDEIDAELVAEAVL